MNKQEAYEILGLDYGASKEEIKKRFKKLSKEKHPDKNPKYAEEFKKISSAFSYLKNPPPEPESNPFSGGFNPFSGMGFDIGDFFSSFGGQTRRRHTVSNIRLNTKISFKESVIGCHRKLTFKKQSFCDSCDGNGSIPSTDDCIKCGGKGFILNQSLIGNRRVSVKSNCMTCSGTGKRSEDCDACSTMGTKMVESTVDVKVPGGILDGQIIRLARVGHLGTDAYLIINVEPEENMRIEGQDVISNIRISLLDAIKGSTKKVKTVFGDKELSINPKTKHLDRTKISKCGVEQIGDHIFIIEIEYPEDTKKLIEVLEKGDL